MSTQQQKQASEEIMRAVNNKNLLVKQLSTARVSLEHKRQLMTRSRLTLEELAPIEEDAKSYRAVGRMFVKSDLKDVRVEIQTIIDTEIVEVEKLEKAVVALTQRVQAAEADFRELVAALQGPVAAK
jgi:chaperonin cofactor prefoldin